MRKTTFIEKKMKEYKGIQKNQPTKTPQLKEGGPTEKNVNNGIITKGL